MFKNYSRLMQQKTKKLYTPIGIVEEVKKHTSFGCPTNTAHE